MAQFNYSRFRYFDKNGSEIILKKFPSFSFVLVNENDPLSQTEYMFVRSVPDDASTNIYTIASNGSFERVTVGYRYPITVTDTGKQDSSLDALYKGNQYTLGSRFFGKAEQSASNKGIQYSPKLTTSYAPTKRDLLSIFTDSIDFPSYTFEGKIAFEKVSTELVETQSIYVLIDNDTLITPFGTDKYSTLYEYAHGSPYDAPSALNYINRFKLFFFIDNRSQSDFRLFKTNGSDVIWTDRITLDLANGSTDYVFDNGYRVDIGFCGKEEGVYEQDLYVCLLDTSNNDTVYPIGTIHMTAETVGEDERYRTFFTNFGIPDPKEYDNIFKETPDIEDGIDYISVNKHSKQMYLSYPEIFPYVGTYKALINAIRTLGYDDIFFKEWYKEMGRSSYEDGGYVTYDLQYGSNPKANTISNIPIEERIHLKKMNWISMFYKINEVVDGPVDRWGFPSTVSKSNYYSSNNLVKIISLKKWLEKYIIGVNCRITGISGEGIVFERYSLPKHGSYQQVLDYRNQKPIYPIIKDEAVSLIDSSAYIDVEISVNRGNITIEETYPDRFLDYCEGYFNENGKYLNSYDELEDSSAYVYYGKTFELNETYGQVDLITKCETKNFCLATYNGYINFGTSRNLVIENDRIIFDPHSNDGNINNKLFTTFAPENLPIIEIKEGYIKRYNDRFECDGSIGYVAEIRKQDDNLFAIIHDINSSAASTINFGKREYVTLTPPDSYTSTEIHISPVSKKLGCTDVAEIVKNGYNNYTESVYTINGLNKEYFSFGESTYGLVYNTDNVNGMPCFKMTGYESEYVWNEYGKHLPDMVDGTTTPDYDYYVEILEGRMLFKNNSDDETVAIVFSHEGNKRKIDIEIYKNTHCLLQHRYHNDISSYISRFIAGNTYGYFVNEYKQDVDAAILFDNSASIKVYNQGVYTICAVLHDEYNNIFSTKSSTRVNVTPSDIDVYVLGSNSGDSVSIDSNDKKDSSVCIFEYVPKLHVNDIDTSTLKISLDGKAKYQYEINQQSTPVPDTGTLILNGNDTQSKYINISNSVDRFVLPAKGTLTLDASTFTVYNMVKRSVNMYNTYCSDKTSSVNAARKLCNDSSTNAYENLILLYLDRNNNIEGTAADVYVTVFDNVCSKPVYSCAAIMNSMYDPSTDIDAKNEYLLMFYDNPSVVENYINRTRYSIYITPAWSLIARKFSDSDSEISIVNENGVAYPFTRKFDKDDLCKITYSDNNKKYFGQLTTSIRKKQTYPGYIDTNINYLTGLQDASLWLSPTTLEFVSYKMTGNNFDTSTFKLKLENTIQNKRTLKYIDKSFTVEKRDFDIDNAIECWMTDASIGDLTSMYNSETSFTTNTGKIVLKANPNFTTGEMKTKRWSIYKRTGKSNSKLYFECYNNVLFLNLDKGTYDVKLTAFDKHGNKYEKRLNGWITVK